MAITFKITKIASGGKMSAGQFQETEDNAIKLASDNTV